MTKLITILVPVFNESRNVPRLVEELDKVSASIPRYDFRYVFIDDGSRDDTVKVCEELSGRNPKVSVIELSRNFGKEIALTAGVDHLDSDAVIIMDADLQHPPSYIPQFIKKWEEGYEIVATKRVSSENEPLLRKLGSKLFYIVMNMISEFKMEPQTTDFRLLDRIVIEALKSFREQNRMVRGIIDWMGFKKTYINFEAAERTAGVAGYSYDKLFKLASDSVTSFSLFPLKLAGYLGILISGLSLSMLVVMLVDRLTFNHFNITNIAFVIVVNCLLNGIVLCALGLISLYIGNIHTEVVNRPLYIIRKYVNCGLPRPTHNIGNNLIGKTNT